MKISTALAIAVVILCSAHLKAQTSDTTFLRWHFNNIIEEKLRIEPHELREFLRDPAAFRTKQNAGTVTESPRQIPHSQLQSIKDKPVDVSQNESEVHAAINPVDTANILCSANTFTTSSTTNFIYYTKDFGATWRKSTFSASPRGGGIILGGGDPMFAFDANGKAYFSWINLFYDQTFTASMHMYWAQSTDKGTTWQRNDTNDLIDGGKLNFSNPNDPTSVSADKQWMVCDLSDSPFKNSLYCSFLLGKNGFTGAATKFKRANESTFVTAELRPVTPKGEHYFQQFNSVDVDESGNLHSCYTAAKTTDDFENGNLIIQHLYSTDGGKSWSRETNAQRITFLRGDITSPVNSPEAPTGISRVNTLPQIACDKFMQSKHKGNVYLAWTAVGTTQRDNNGLDIYFSRSSDKGATWSKPIIINDDAKGRDITQAYVTIGVNENGVIALCWYDRRNDPNNLLGDYYIALSYDGGATFKPNVRITSLPTDFGKFTGNREFGVGEYNQVVMTKHYALPFWGDGRSGNQTKIYMGYVPLNDNSIYTTSVERITNVNGDCTITGITPNPAPQSATISYTVREATTLDIELIALNGSVMQRIPLGRQNEGASSVTLSTSGLTAGSYSVVLRSPSSTSMMKLVVER
ncbi:MAG: T9SS type A sorting domain-containing protein [Candidatus Kapabacteria bacterium]|nr:T9SS type A sorting domain-containing protein [Candidatus Kapabacteria bacterium]